MIGKHFETEPEKDVYFDKQKAVVAVQDLALKYARGNQDDIEVTCQAPGSNIIYRAEILNEEGYITLFELEIN